MGIIAMIVIGFLIGLVARFLKPGNDSMGFIMTTVLGMVGAFVGGFLGQMLGIYEPNEPVGFLASVIGAIIVLFVASALFGRKTKAV